MSARKKAGGPSQPRTVAVRVLPKRTLALDERTYLAFDELELPKADADTLRERGIVQLASEKAPAIPEPTAEVPGPECPECGAHLGRGRRPMTPEDVEQNESWTK